MNNPNGKPKNERRKLLVRHDKYGKTHVFLIRCDIRAAIFISDALKELETKHAYRMVNLSDPPIHRARKKNGAVPEESLRRVENGEG